MTDLQCEECGSPKFLLPIPFSDNTRLECGECGFRLCTWAERKAAIERVQVPLWRELYRLDRKALRKN
jgi:hypothetical protein